MSNANENSSLIALRALREIEKRRLAEERQARATVERQQRERQAAQAQQSARERERVEREAVAATARAEAERLGRELESARAEIVHLRGQLLVSAPAVESVPPAAAKSWGRLRAAAWLAISAGAMMLVGGLALTVATPPAQSRVVKIETRVREPAAACPAVESTGTASPPLSGPPRGAREIPGPRKRLPRSRPPSSHRPAGRAKPGGNVVECDGTDPLCGIDPKVVDDIGGRRRKSGKR